MLHKFLNESDYNSIIVVYTYKQAMNVTIWITHIFGSSATLAQIFLRTTLPTFDNNANNYNSSQDYQTLL